MAGAYPVSPIRILDDAIRNSPFRVAPERSEELRQRYPHLAERFAFLDPGNEVLRAEYDEGTQQARILAYTPGLELLWFGAYSFWRMYQLLRQAQIRGGTHLDADEFEEKRRLEVALADGVLSFERSATPFWPEKFPHPSVDYWLADDRLAATNLFLAGVGWTAHHEIAHIDEGHLTHRSGFPARLAEFEADELAASWVMSKVTSPAERQKRLLGIVTALGGLALRRAAETHADREGLHSHPHPFQRLLRVLNNHTPDNTVCAYAIASIQTVMMLGKWFYVPFADLPFCELLADLDHVFRLRERGGAWALLPEDLARAYFLRLQYPIPESIVRQTAYRKWEERGCQWSSPDVDWYAAKRKLYDALRDPDFSDWWVPDPRTLAEQLGKVEGTIDGQGLEGHSDASGTPL